MSAIGGEADIGCQYMVHFLFGGGRAVGSTNYHAANPVSPGARARATLRESQDFLSAVGGGPGISNRNPRAKPRGLASYVLARPDSSTGHLPISY